MKQRILTIFSACLLSAASIGSSPATAATVLFDQGHNQRFLAGETGPLQLSGLAGQFTQKGFTVTTQNGPLSKEALAGVTALVISGPFAPYTPAEVDAIVDFVEQGGRLAIMLHIGSPLIPLLDRLGVVVSNSVIHEQENIIKDDALNFRVTRFEPGPLSQGLQQFSIYGGWALLNNGPNTAVVARTGDKAWVDLNRDRTLTPGDAVQAFAVAVSGTAGTGRFVVFGDDAIFQNQHLDESNSILAANLVSWLE
ncbi:MAG: DUF4350 domain-containing protein [Geobacter sp.]|nr:DUF4350 domain-containing protein [Geobacter sp.]